MSLTAEERTLRSRNASLARTAKGRDNTEPARQAFRDRFVDLTLPPKKRAKSAEAARRLFYIGIAKKSADARRLKKEVGSS